MRVKASGDKKLEDYDTWTVSIGDGTANDINGLVSIPEYMFYMIKPNTSSDTKADRILQDGVPRHQHQHCHTWMAGWMINSSSYQ